MEDHAIDRRAFMALVDAEEAAKSLGIQLKIVKTRAPTDLEGAFSRVRMDAVGGHEDPAQRPPR
jgi:hypothetical protein